MCESGLLEDEIEALKDIDTYFADEQDEELLEEGEFVPDDVADWESDNEDVQVHAEDAQEHLLPPMKVTEVMVDVSENQKVDDLDEAQSKLNQESQTDPGIEVVKPNIENEHLKKMWFKDIPEKTNIVYKEDIEIPGVGDLKKGIIS